MMSGVAIRRSNSIQPSWMRGMSSSEPTTSAPAASASLTLSPLAMTATRTVLPVPAGSATVERTCWSACLTLMPRRICISTVSSNLAFALFLTIARPSAGV
ncbi:hypothetical protein D3C87_745800 [compost metagenome]